MSSSSIPCCNSFFKWKATTKFNESFLEAAALIRLIYLSFLLNWVNVSLILSLAPLVKTVKFSTCWSVFCLSAFKSPTDDFSEETLSSQLSFSTKHFVKFAFTATNYSLAFSCFVFKASNSLVEAQDVIKNAVVRNKNIFFIFYSVLNRLLNCNSIANL